MRMEESLPTHHEDHIAGKGENSLQHYNLVHKFIPMPQAMKIPAAEAAMEKHTWIRLPRHKWPKSWSSMEDPVVLLERNLYGHPFAGLLW